MTPKICLVILNWNGAEDTLACLNSLRALSYPNFHVIVVENGSTDDSLSRLQAFVAPYPLELLATGCNLGYAGGNNAGIRRALETGADFILVLNNDTVVASDLLDRLNEAAQRHPKAGMFSPRVMYMEPREKIWFDGARWNASTLRMECVGQGKKAEELSDSDHETESACGAALFIRAETVQQIGLLDENYFLVWEEVDWSFRARGAGWSIFVVPKAVVWHKIGVSFGSESSPLRKYFSIRNELLWFRHHASLNARIRLWAANLRRLIPRFHIGSDASIGLVKRSVWALRDYILAWSGRGTRLEYLAARRAILDFAKGHFGDCPAEIRAWNRLWADRTSVVYRDTATKQ